MKDALGHGSNGRGGAVRAAVGHAFQSGIAAARAVPRTALAAMKDTRGGGPDMSHAAISFMARHGDKFDPQTIGELPAARMVGMAIHAMGF